MGMGPHYLIHPLDTLDTEPDMSMEDFWKAVHQVRQLNQTGTKSVIVVPKVS